MANEKLRNKKHKKQVKDVLTESEERNHTLIQLSPDLIGVHRKGQIVFLNTAGARLLGESSPDQFIGKHIREFIHPDYWQMVKGQLQEASRRGVLAPAIEQKFVKADGTSIDTEVKAVNVMYEGKPAVLVVARDISERKKVEQELRDSHDRLRSLSAHLQRVREQERMAIAREIHGELGQTLTALKIECSWLKRRLSNEAAMLTNKAISVLVLIDKALKTVKEISAKLRPVLLDDLGLVAAIEWRAQEFQNRTGIETKYRFSSNIQDAIIDEDTSTAIFCILQESLTNVNRHARARSVGIRLQYVGTKLLLRVTDNGTGIKESQISAPQSFGLIGIREHAYSCGGEAKIWSPRKRGTIVSVCVPLKEIKLNAKNPDS